MNTTTLMLKGVVSSTAELFNSAYPMFYLFFGLFLLFLFVGIIQKTVLKNTKRLLK